MAKVFIPGTNQECELVTKAIKKYHGDLFDNKVTVGLLFVEHGPDDEDPGPALKHHGYPAAAVVKVNSYRDRVEGKPDATITIDREKWNDLDDKEKAALIDHELQHLELRFDGDGLLKKDDLGRPKLKIRLHDWQLGGFEAVIRRHGEAAIEQQEFRKVAEERKQLLLAWG